MKDFPAGRIAFFQKIFYNGKKLQREKTRTSAKRKVPSLEIAEELRRKIRGENISTGTHLISSRALARHYKGSMSMEHKALQSLAEEGILYRRQGSGTYVGKHEPDKTKPMVIGCNFRNRSNDRLEKNFCLNRKLMPWNICSLKTALCGCSRGRDSTGEIQ